MEDCLPTPQLVAMYRGCGPIYMQQPPLKWVYGVLDHHHDLSIEIVKLLLLFIYFIDRWDILFYFIHE